MGSISNINKFRCRQPMLWKTISSLCRGGQQPYFLLRCWFCRHCKEPAKSHITGFSVNLDHRPQGRAHLLSKVVCLSLPVLCLAASPSQGFAGNDQEETANQYSGFFLPFPLKQEHQSSVVCFFQLEQELCNQMLSQCITRLTGLPVCRSLSAKYLPSHLLHSVNSAL